MSLDPKALAVLADALRSVLPESDAAEVLRWATHPEAVRTLIALMPVAVNHDGGEIHAVVCPDCFESTYEAHGPACKVTAAWRALGDPRGAADIERTHVEALREHRRRFPRTAADLTERLFAAGGIDLDMDEVHAATRLTDASVNAGARLLSIGTGIEPQPWDVRAYQTSETILGVAAENLEAGCRIEYRLGGPPTQPVRRFADIPNDRPLFLMAQRHESDARGMEAVEAEARLANAGRAFTW